MQDTNVETVRDPQKQVVVAEHNIYPDARFTVDSGTIQAAGDKVKAVLSVVDKDGNPRCEDQKLVYKFKDLPVDTNKEILCVLTFCATESTKPGPIINP